MAVEPPGRGELPRPPEGWWEEVLALTPDAVFTLSLEGTITSWNPGAERLWGFASKEVLGNDLRMLGPNERFKEVQEILARVGAGKTVAPLETRWRRRDGAPIDVSISVTPLMTDAGTVDGAAAIARDISDRKRFEELLAREVAARESYEQQLIDLNRQLRDRLTVVETLLEVLPVGIGIAYDRNCTRVRVNDTLAAMLHLEPGTLVVKEGFPADDAPFALYKGGKPLPREGHPLQRAARTGRPAANVELELRYPGREPRYILCFAAPLLDDSGEPGGAICACIDLTEQHEAEVQLQQANAIKDDFLAMVSHELRTPLTVVLGLARLLSRDSISMEPAMLKETLAQMRTDAERLANVIENMLILARLDHERADLEPLRVSRVIERAIAEHRMRFPQREVESDLNSVSFVEGHAGWLEQIVSNLLTNAEKYSPPDEPVEITLSDHGDTVQICVGDHGPGINPVDAEDLFEPFYRSQHAIDAMIPGLGLGLTVGKRLTELQGGTIEVRRRDGGGTEFIITLPAIGYDM